MKASHQYAGPREVLCPSRNTDEALSHWPVVTRFSIMTPSPLDVMGSTLLQIGEIYKTHFTIVRGYLPLKYAIFSTLETLFNVL